MANHYLVKLVYESGELRYVRRIGLTGGQPIYTVSESLAHRFPTEGDAEKLARHYKGSAWTAEVVTVHK